MEDTNELINQRFKKLDDIYSLGINPFNNSFDPQDISAEIKEKYNLISKEQLETSNIPVSIAGRIIAIRDFGKGCFAHLQDITGKIQIFFSKNILKEKFSILKKLDVGDIIGISGKLFKTKTDELTVSIEDFVLLSKSLRPLPEKWHGLKDIEIRYRQRYVDLIVNPDVKDVFAKRSAIIKALRDFLESKGFIEVETPMMHQIPGGAVAMPFKTHHNALDIDLYLRVAPELYLKRLLVGGYERVFELNKNFRNEGISVKHNPEFTMLEFYMAYKDYNFLMSFTEEMFSYLANKILGTFKLPYGNLEIDLTPPWRRLSMLDALKEKGLSEDIIQDRQKILKWAEVNKIELSPNASFAKILDEIFKEKVELELIQPIFITDYPVELSPLAKRKQDNPKLVERFELFIAGREIANAFSELNDPIDQKERFLKQVEAREKGDEETHWMDEDFISALEYGMPTAAGEGIGIDRLVMLFTNSHSIKDVILFPQLKPL